MTGYGNHKRMEGDSFRSLMETGDWQGVASDFSAGGDAILIASGGLKGQLGLPIFEFVKTKAELGVKRIFLLKVLREALGKHA